MLCGTCCNSERTTYLYTVRWEISCMYCMWHAFSPSDQAIAPKRLRQNHIYLPTVATRMNRHAVLLVLPPKQLVCHRWQSDLCHIEVCAPVMIESLQQAVFPLRSLVYVTAYMSNPSILKFVPPHRRLTLPLQSPCNWRRTMNSCQCCHGAALPRYPCTLYT